MQQLTSNAKQAISKAEKSALESHRQVFLTGLSGFVREQELLDFLRSQASGVLSVVLPKRSNSGYAFVRMRDEASAEQILKLKNMRFKERGLQIKEFMEGKKLSSFKKEVNLRRLFVYSIPKRTKDEEIRELFSRFGQIEDAYIIRDRKTKKSRCFGYVVFTDPEIAQMVASMKLIAFEGKDVKVQMHDSDHNTKKKKEEEMAEQAKQVGGAGEEIGDANQSEQAAQDNSEGKKAGNNAQKKKGKKNKKSETSQNKKKGGPLMQKKGKRTTLRADQNHQGFSLPIPINPGQAKAEFSGLFQEFEEKNPLLNQAKSSFKRSSLTKNAFYGGPNCPVDPRYRLNFKNSNFVDTSVPVPASLPNMESFFTTFPDMSVADYNLFSEFFWAMKQFQNSSHTMNTKIARFNSHNFPNRNVMNHGNNNNRQGQDPAEFDAEELDLQQDRNQSQVNNTVQKDNLAHQPTLGFHALKPSNTSHFPVRCTQFSTDDGRYRYQGGNETVSQKRMKTCFQGSLSK